MPLLFRGEGDHAFDLRGEEAADPSDRLFLFEGQAATAGPRLV